MAAEIEAQRRICACFCPVLTLTEVLADGTPGFFSEVGVACVVCTRLQPQGEDDHDRKGQAWVTTSHLHLPVESPCQDVVNRTWMFQIFSPLTVRFLCAYICS